MGMKFRQYLSAKDVPPACVPLTETDLLGAPSIGASTTDPKGSSTTDPRATAGPQSPEGGGTPLGSGRPPDQMDDQIRQVGTLAIQLLKALTTLPPPWNKRFHMFMRPLQGLVAKLEEIS